MKNREKMDAQTANKKIDNAVKSFKEITKPIQDLLKKIAKVKIAEPKEGAIKENVQYQLIRQKLKISWSFILLSTLFLGRFRIKNPRLTMGMFIGLFIGILLGAAFIKYVLPKVLKEDRLGYYKRDYRGLGFHVMEVRSALIQFGDAFLTSTLFIYAYEFKTFGPVFDAIPLILLFTALGVGLMFLFHSLLFYQDKYISVEEYTSLYNAVEEGAKGWKDYSKEDIHDSVLIFKKGGKDAEFIRQAFNKAKQGELSETSEIQTGDELSEYVVDTLSIRRRGRDLFSKIEEEKSEEKPEEKIETVPEVEA